MPKQPKRKPASSKPGPKPVVPTNGERRLVTLAVSIGMTVDQIAAVINMSRRTVYRVFADDLANGHARRLLRSAARLEEMAEAGNVSAAKFLHTLIMDRGGHPAGDQWADVAASFVESSDAEDNLAQNPEIRDLH